MRTWWGVLLILTFGAAPTWAVLGEPESSVNLDARAVRGQVRFETHEGYRVQQVTDPSGAVIREYVSPAGKIFGVAWQGPYLPNMPQLLGSYFTHLQQFAQAQTRRRGGPLTMQNDDFVFSSGGHMRWYHGHAYVPSLLPANLSPGVVQ